MYDFSENIDFNEIILGITELFAPSKIHSKAN